MRLIVKLDLKSQTTLLHSVQDENACGFLLDPEIHPYPATLVYIFSSKT